MEREIHIMDVQPTNLQQLCDAIMTIWTNISEECFQNLVESMQLISKLYLIKWPVSVYSHFGVWNKAHEDKDDVEEERSIIFNDSTRVKVKLS